MSYILDALRRADAERERDPARGIHAQPAAGLPAGPAGRGRRWIWSAGAGALVLAAAVAWWLPRQSAVAPVVAVAPQAPVAMPVTATPTPTPVVVPVATTVSPPPPAPAPIPVAVVEKAPVKAMTVSVPVKAPPPVAPVTIATVPEKAPAIAAPLPTNPAAPAPAQAPAAERIVAMADLPADVQRELPKLAISGGVHSENASQRLLIVGGQIMTEGAEVAPGVTLEQIRARTAVMRFKGFRYSVPF